MGCGCNKNKQNQQPAAEGETPVSPNLEFRKESNPQDIKGLLAAINSTLSGPLSIKNNKPFRPTSNMLD
jgi:hypothetical protein